MILTDTGPLVAMCDQGDPDHEACVSAAHHVRPPMISTMAVVTEAMYLLHRIGGWKAQANLWTLLSRGDLELRDLDAQELSRCHDLMRQYSDVPMDFADATLVALAERLHFKRVFTLDSHFHAYRLNGRVAFQVLP